MFNKQAFLDGYLWKSAGDIDIKSGAGPQIHITSTPRQRPVRPPSAPYETRMWPLFWQDVTRRAQELKTSKPVTKIRNRPIVRNGIVVPMDYDNPQVTENW